MLAFWNALVEEVSHVVPDAQTFARVLVRLTFAVLLTGIIGWERERGHKTAGLRTHLMVAIGSALFVLVLENTEGDNANQAVSRVIQGITAGVGFIGGGAILKLESQNKIRGLTTAGSVWFAAAIGVAAGMGKLSAAIAGTIFAMIVLSSLAKLEIRNRKTPLIIQSQTNQSQTGEKIIDSDDIDDDEN
jgi:putative Mg2+ transporter-C (MgtC) family protein